jgi:Cd2+/Zn2+-exporting ATPase
VTRTGHESTLGKVIALMQNAERSKPPITRLLERYAGSYMVLVLLLAAVTWFITNDAQAMLAVLVAACPCALVLSAPATAIAGVAVAARHGILIRSSAFLEELADLTSLVVDKTGTLTFGTLRLQSIDSPLEDRSHVLKLAASLGSASSHPVSRALAGLVAQEHFVLLIGPARAAGAGRGGDDRAGRSRARATGVVRPLGHHHDQPFPITTARLPGWRSTVSFSPGCCSQTASNPKRSSP